MALSRHKKSKAIRYNARRGYSKEFIKTTQGIVGVPQTGVWDDLTAVAVYRWQGEEGLGQDGYVGPKTKARLVLAAGADAVDDKVDCTCLPPVSVSMWFDHAGSHAARHADRHTDTVLELGVSRLAIMLTSSKQSELPHFKWRLKDIEKFCQVANDKGIKIVLTFWPRPRPTHLENLFSRLDDYIKASGAYAIEPDVEGNWRSRYRKRYHEDNPYADYDEASAALVDYMNEAKCKHGIQTGSTTFADHWELDHRGDAAVCGNTDYFALQVYSNYDKGDKAVGTKYGPDQFASHGMRRVRSVGMKNKVEIALAAWDQEDFPGISAQEAMRMAVQTAVKEGCTDLWYWSWKWVAGHYKRQYAFDFIKGLKKK